VPGFVSPEARDLIKRVSEVPYRVHKNETNRYSSYLFLILRSVSRLKIFNNTLGSSSIALRAKERICETQAR
jgi:hypothetical protein